MNLMNKLYWGFWCSTTVLVGILAGFFIAHSLLLGPFFSWFIESGKVDLLRQTFSVYRATAGYSHLYNLYYAPIFFHLFRAASGQYWLLF